MRRGFPILLLLACACHRPTRGLPVSEEVPTPPAPPAPVAAPDEPGFVVHATATYPGASAKVMDQSIASYMHRLIHGVEGAARVESDSRDDGTCTVTVHFGPKVDRDAAATRVQERVNRVDPFLPDEVRRNGVTVRKAPAVSPQFWLALTSPDGKHDALFLSNYATLRLRDEIARVPGVADVTVHGAGAYAIRAWVDPDRLAARGLTAADVADALRRQNVQVAAGQIGQPPTPAGQAFSFALTSLGRLADPKDLEAIVLKTTGDGKIVYLRDVARVELGASTSSSSAGVNGKPAALLAVTAWPGERTGERLRKAAADAARAFPDGVRLDLVVDRTADRLAVVEVLLPEAASRERTDEIVRKGCDAVRALPGKPECVTVGDDHTPNAATVMVRLADGGPTAADVRKALDSPPGAVFRVSDVPAGREAFPVRLAVLDTGDHGVKEHFELADKVAAAINTGGAATGAVAFPGPSVPQLLIEVDREKCARLGVPVSDLFAALQVYAGGLYVHDFNKFGRTYEVRVTGPGRDLPDDLKRLKVRSRDGEMVPLGTVLTVRVADAAPAVLRVDVRRAVIITADPAAGQTVAEAAAACLKLAGPELPKGYEVKDLSGPPR